MELDARHFDGDAISRCRGVKRAAGDIAPAMVATDAGRILRRHIRTRSEP